jgi:hypothetical protein
MIDDNYGDFEFDSENLHKRQKTMEDKGGDDFDALENSVFIDHSLLEKPLDFDIVILRIKNFLK